MALWAVDVAEEEVVWFGAMPTAPTVGPHGRAVVESRRRTGLVPSGSRTADTPAVDRVASAPSESRTGAVRTRRRTVIVPQESE